MAQGVIRFIISSINAYISQVLWGHYHMEKLSLCQLYVKIASGLQNYIHKIFK